MLSVKAHLAGALALGLALSLTASPVAADETRAQEDGPSRKYYSPALLGVGIGMTIVGGAGLAGSTMFGLTQLGMAGHGGKPGVALALLGISAGTIGVGATLAVIGAGPPDIAPPQESAHAPQLLVGPGSVGLRVSF